MGRVDDKVVIITGAASGQGKEEARLFASEGAKVVATDVQEEALTKVVEEIKSSGGDIIGLKLDVSNEDEWNQVVQSTIEQYGKIDTLVNNAGIGGAEGYLQLNELDLKTFEKFIAINTTGQFLGMKAVAPEMIKAGGGSIINISSIAGLIGGQAGVHYTASKGASRLMSKEAAIELAPHNIRVNSLHPGGVVTPMLSALTENEELLNEALKTIPLGRLAEPIEIATVVLFLATDEASYITGTEIVVDGGVTAQ